MFGITAVVVVFAPLACTESSFEPASSSVEVSSLWYSLDRPGCVDCSGKGPAARAWAEARPPSRDAQAQANFVAALAGQPPPFPLFDETFKVEIAPRPRALTAQAFAPRLTWNDMEPISIVRLPGRWSDHLACTSVRTRKRPVCLGRRC